MLLIDLIGSQIACPQFQTPSHEFQALERKIASAPLDVRGPLAEAFLLPYKASPTEIAQAIPGLQKRAKELAKHHTAPVAFALILFF